MMPLLSLSFLVSRAVIVRGVRDQGGHRLHTSTFIYNRKIPRLSEQPRDVSDRGWEAPWQSIYFIFLINRLAFRTIARRNYLSSQSYYLASIHSLRKVNEPVLPNMKYSVRVRSIIDDMTTSLRPLALSVTRVWGQAGLDAYGPPKERGDFRVIQL